MSGEKSYDEYQAENKRIRKKIDSIPPSYDCPEGKHYLVDEKDGVVYYDCRNNHEGLMDRTLQGKPDDTKSTFFNMKKIAIEEKKPVVTMFNGGLVVVDEKITLDECLANYHARIEKESDAYASQKTIKKTVKKKMREIKDKIERVWQKIDKAEYDKIMAEEKFEAASPDLLKKFNYMIDISMRKDSSWDGRVEGDLMKAAAAVAKVCQHEMKKNGEQKLSRRTYDRAKKTVMHFDTVGDYVYFAGSHVNSALVAYWKHGDEVGKFYGYEGDRLREFQNNRRRQVDESIHREQNLTKETPADKKVVSLNKVKEKER